MLLKEAQEKLGMNRNAIYQQIHRKTPLGKIFRKNEMGRLECYAKDLRKFLK
jgi:hypothetical protein